MNDHLLHFIYKFKTVAENLNPIDFDFVTFLLKGFPHRCCDDSSQLLAAYMTDNGFEGSQLIRGEYGGYESEIVSHVWLDYKGLLIDITAEQFNNYGYNHSSIIFPNDSCFHSSFRVVNDGIADFRIHLKKYSDSNLENQFLYSY